MDPELLLLAGPALPLPPGPPVGSVSLGALTQPAAAARERDTEAITTSLRFMIISLLSDTRPEDGAVNQLALRRAATARARPRVRASARPPSPESSPPGTEHAHPEGCAGLRGSGGPSMVAPVLPPAPVAALLLLAPVEPPAPVVVPGCITFVGSVGGDGMSVLPGT